MPRDTLTELYQKSKVYELLALPPAQDKKAQSESPAHVQKDALHTALAYAAKGKSIFPCCPKTKRPLTRHGFKDATSDPDTIKMWWKKHPKAMIGLPTGEVNGIFVIDCDTVDARDALLAMCPSGETFQPTLTVKTPRGWHYYYKMPELQDGQTLSCTASKLAAKLDSRGTGGYIIAPGSRRVDGSSYEVLDPSIPIAPMPHWLIDKMVGQKPAKSAVTGKPLHTSVHTAYVQAALGGEVEKVRTAPKGERNARLNRAAYALGQLVGVGGLSEDEIIKVLEEAAHYCGLVQEDGLVSVQKTILSGLTKGREKPRNLPVRAYTPVRLIAHASNQQPTTDIAEPVTSNILGAPAPVPLEAFPATMRDVLIEASQAFCVPLQIPAAALLALLSCLVGRSRAVEPKRGWREHGNLWIAILAKSARGKTPVLQAFFKPIDELEHTAYVVWKKKYDLYRQELQNYNKKGVIPEPPACTQLYLDDCTPEAIGDALAQNEKGIMLRTDEISGLIANFGRYSKSGKEGGTRARLLSSYDAQPWKINRKDQTKSLYIPSACISIVGGLQPKMLAACFDDTDLFSGFVPRFVFIRAELEQPAYWSEANISSKTEALLQRIVAHLAQYQPMELPKGGNIPYTIELTKDAKDLFVAWFNILAKEGWDALNAGQSDTIQQKLKGQALRICLLLHCLDAALAGHEALDPIPVDTMRRALMLADWIKLNQQQVMSLFSSAQDVRVNTPIEIAIIESIVALADQINSSGGKISNADLIAAVNARLSIAATPEQVGRSASKLGLPAHSFGKPAVRGRLIPQEKLTLFRATVGTPTPPIQPTDIPFSDTSDCMETVCQTSHHLEDQASPTVPTGPTVSERPSESFQTQCDD